MAKSTEFVYSSKTHFQLKYTFQSQALRKLILRDFVELVKEDLREIDVYSNIDHISQKIKTKFKAQILKTIQAIALKELTATQMTHSKIREIKYEELEIQPNMESGIFTNIMVKTPFNTRNSMTRYIKNNLSSMQCIEDIRDA